MHVHMLFPQMHGVCGADFTVSEANYAPNTTKQKYLFFPGLQNRPL